LAASALRHCFFQWFNSIRWWEEGYLACRKTCSTCHQRFCLWKADWNSSCRTVTIAY